MVLAYGETYRPAGAVLAVLIWAVPVALLNGHYRYALVACDHERLEFRSNAIAAVVAVVLGFILIPRYGAFGAALVLVASALVVLFLAYAATLQAGVLVPPIAMGLPAWSAVAVAGLVARQFVVVSSWVAALAAAIICLSLFLLYEFRRLFGLRAQPVNPSTSAALGTARGR
jgi:O-antigen/teichoic acid export membrane protein